MCYCIAILAILIISSVKKLHLFLEKKQKSFFVFEIDKVLCFES